MLRGGGAPAGPPPDLVKTILKKTAPPPLSQFLTIYQKCMKTHAIQAPCFRQILSAQPRWQRSPAASGQILICFPPPVTIGQILICLLVVESADLICRHAATKPIFLVAYSNTYLRISHAHARLTHRPCA